MVVIGLAAGRWPRTASFACGGGGGGGGRPIAFLGRIAVLKENYFIDCVDDDGEQLGLQHFSLVRCWARTRCQTRRRGAVRGGE